MTHLCWRHIGPLLACIRGMYQVRDLDAFPGQLLYSVSSVVASEVKAFVEVNGQNDKARYWVLPSGVAGGDTDPAWQRLLEEHPILARHREMSDGQALRTSDLAPMPPPHRTARYEEHYRRFGIEHMVGVSFFAPGPVIGSLVLFVGIRTFPEPSAAFSTCSGRTRCRPTRTPP